MYDRENCISDLGLEYGDGPEKIADVPQEKIVEHLLEYTWTEKEYIQYMIENLYVLLIDFIYFDNQSEFIGYSIKKIMWKLWDEINLFKEPYLTIKKENSKYIENAFSLLRMNEDEKYQTYNKSEAINNPDISLENLIDNDNWMKVLIKYSKDIRYVG